ncbi:MAG: VOC family protein [Rubrivivax sp.]
MRIEPYLNMDGCAEEAIDFYRQALGAEVEMLMRMKDSPEPPPPGMVPPGTDNKVMHASLRIGQTRLMLSDGPCSGKAEFRGVTLSLASTDLAAAKRWFDALAAGGEVQMPLEKTFWSPAFGMVKDRFGVSWMINGEA